MLSKLVMQKHYAQRLGKTRHTVRFRAGVNLLVGPNGSGKSTIIESLAKDALVKEKCDQWGGKARDQTRHASIEIGPGPDLQIFIFDFEKDNPRVGSSGSLMDLASIRRMAQRWEFIDKSHGMFTRAVLDELKGKIRKSHGQVLLILDEPEQALDLDGIRQLHKLLTRELALGAQAFIATHHPFLMTDDSFHYIEMRQGYRTEVLSALRRAAEHARKFHFGGM